MIKKLFEPCYMEYKAIDKPVQYTEEFLQELASMVNETTLVEDKHLGENIGTVSNFTVIDGALFGNVSSEKALDNLKYSPYIDCSLEDKGEFYLAIDPTGLKDVALTSNPRKPVQLPNTGGSNMSDNETIKILNGQVKDLNKELAIANNKLEANKDKLSKIEEMETELEELRQWKFDNEKLIEEQKPIIEAYKKDQETKRSDLVKKLSKGNEEVAKKIKDVDLETLELWDSLEVQEQPPKGVGAHNAQGLNEGDGETDEEKEQTARKEAVEGMFDDLFKEE